MTTSLFIKLLDIIPIDSFVSVYQIRKKLADYNYSYDYSSLKMNLSKMTKNGILLKKSSICECCNRGVFYYCKQKKIYFAERRL